MENLKREIKEETNLDLVSEPRLVAAQDIMPKPDRHVVRLTYIGEIQGEPVLDTEENDAFQWVSLEELKGLDDLDIYLKEVLEKGLIG